MSKMLSADFTTNTEVDLVTTGPVLVVKVAGVLGGGLVSIRKWSAARNDYRTIASFTAVTLVAQQIAVGHGQRMQLALTGALAANVEIDYWFV